MSSSTSTSSSSLQIPPKSPYGIYQGTLFQFHRNLVAFESNISAANKCILLGGLSDGLIPTPYCKGLENKCKEEGWSLVQPILSSSYLGFGNGDLDRDVSELNFLLQYLKEHNCGSINSVSATEERGKQQQPKFALVGHSTGCQISMHYLKCGLYRNMISLVVLQAPVSDREDAMMNSQEKYEMNLAIALEKKEKNEMMPRSAHWAPITAKRFIDLHSVGGMDDYFSSDYTDLQLKERLGHVSTDAELISNLRAVLVAYSGADEYVPKEIDKEQLTQRLVDAMGSTIAIPLYIPNGNHNLSSSQEDRDLFLGKVGELLKEIK